MDSLVRCIQSGTSRVQADATSLEAATRLLRVREARLVARLQRVMAAHKSAVFDTWMKRESELVQGTAQAFIEVYVAGACAEALGRASPALRGLLGRVLRLDALCRVCAQMAWYLTEGLVTAAQAQQVRMFFLCCTTWCSMVACSTSGPVTSCSETRPHDLLGGCDGERARADER